MYFFNLISLLGGLALFLYGMRLMGDSLKEGSSGALKLAMERVTNNPLKAFFLGLAVTAIIQSSTATIVITSGLVAAGIISLRQSLGVIIGANVGTTVTGQILRLLDVSSEGSSWLRIFQPSTLAPIALILGIVFIMFCKFKKSELLGNIAIGFGILFTGLLNMTAAVSVLTESEAVANLFINLGDNPVLGYLVGASVAFVLQSSSATIGMLQAFSLAGDIPFRTVYVVLVGIYLGDCVTTAIVCSIGAKPDAKRVGIVHILFNLTGTVLVIVLVQILYRMGLLNSVWSTAMNSSGIANTNTVFKLGGAIALLPFVGLFERTSKRIVKDEVKTAGKYADKINALNPIFFATPALAFRSCYDILLIMYNISYESIHKALDLFDHYDAKVVEEINEEEDTVDMLTDRVDNYLIQLAPNVSEDLHVQILNHYHKIVSEFEHLSDQSVYIAESATALKDEGIEFSEIAKSEFKVVVDLMEQILTYAKPAFQYRDVEAARQIEPMVEVMDELINTLHDNHLERLRDGKCSIKAGIIFMNALTNIGRVADTCSNVGIATITRANPEQADQKHTYVTSLHQGKDQKFNENFEKTHSLYFNRLEELESEEK